MEKLWTMLEWLHRSFFFVKNIFWLEIASESQNLVHKKTSSIFEDHNIIVKNTNIWTYMVNDLKNLFFFLSN